MTKRVYLMVGVPGSGKTWVTSQLKGNLVLCHHDQFAFGHANQPEVYVDAIKDAAEKSDKPILAEAPFSISAIEGPLKDAGFTVRKVFIVEEPDIIAGRYLRRENKPIPKGHLTRLQTYIQRAAADALSFSGTSAQVLEHLKSL
jgi:adenylate kinase